jgi:DNA polymerase-3 subunit beta
MKLQVTQENLAKALNTVARVASGRSTLPILSNVLLKTVGTRLSIAATNLDIAITCLVGSKISQEGSITVPARLMQDFVSSLPNSVIDLDLQDNKLHITTDKYQSVINGVAAEEFPVMPAIKSGTKWKIPAKVLKEGLQQVVVASSNDEARPVLTGVYFHTNGGNLQIVATDSYRLAEKTLIKTTDDIKLLVPGSAMNDLLRILSDSEAEVQVTHDDQQVLFKVGDTELVTRLIEGNYPDYKKLIPSKFATAATLKRADFLNIAKVSSLFARESAGSIKIEVSEASDQVSIRSVASQLGENTASADCKASGNGDITLNSRYLIDALNVINADEITFGFNGKLEPSVVKAAKDDGYLHIVMPLKS